MARVTRNVFVKVLAFHPVDGMVPVPGAGVFCEDSGWLWDPDLSTGTATTDGRGVAEVEIAFDDGEENTLNPFFTITLPAASRKVPAGAPADEQVPLPEEWVTRHYVNRRIPRITLHTDPNAPLEIYVGLPARLRVSYSDFDTSGIRNPLAVPEDTARIHLADYDDFLWIDWLNPDDTLGGFGADRAGKVVPVGEKPEYPYFDRPPTAPSAFDGLPSAPRAWIDPPGAPVGVLGGGSFLDAGPVAVDPHGFVFLLDGGVIRRFYPDGTLCQTITGPAGALNAPGGIAVDQYRNLFVAETGSDRILLFRLDDDIGPLGGSAGRYHHALIGGSISFGSHGTASGRFDRPTGLAVVPNREVDGEELLAVCDAGNARVQLFRIEVSGTVQMGGGFRQAARRMATRLSVDLPFRAALGARGSGPGQLTEPVGVAADRKGRLFVSDRQLHRVSRWGPAGGAYAHEADWGGSGSGAGRFQSPGAVAADTRGGWIYVADTGNHRVQRLDAESGAHRASWTPTYTPALGGSFTPAGVAADARGEVYVADGGNRRVVRGTPFAPDGRPLPATDAPRAVGAPWTPATEPGHTREPQYLFAAADGRLWVADTGNDRVVAYERAPTGELSLAAGAAFSPPAAGLDGPVGLGTDPDGDLFVVCSGGNFVRRLHFDAAAGSWSHTDFGAAGSGNGQFDAPRGVAVVQRTEPMLYVADTGNGRVQVVRRDGTFSTELKHASSPADALSGPEDVAADARGNVYVADTGNGRVVQYDASDAFVRAFPVPSSGGAAEPCGISVDPEGKLVVTDRGQDAVLRLETDGTVLARWDLRSLAEQQVPIPGHPSELFYYPELARLLVLDRPARAVLDERGLLAVADRGHDRVRLVRSCTELELNLQDLGGSGPFDRLPDISFRAVTEADWKAELGLAVRVGDVNLFDDSHDFVSEPEEGFAGDVYHDRRILGLPRETGAAINIMKVLRRVQRWYQLHTREAPAAQRWGAPGSDRTVEVDIYSSDLFNDRTGEGAFVFLDVNLGRHSHEGRGSNAWDDGVIAHELSHWIFYQVASPYPVLPLNPARWIRMSQTHFTSILSSRDQALSEGWANFVQLFWGDEFGATDRTRGYGIRKLSTPYTTWLWGVSENGSWPLDYLYGGSMTSLLPSFDAPGKGLENEGYFANALFQMHRVLVDPGARFADASSFWHRYDVHVDEAESRRFSETIWKGLWDFSADPPFGDEGSRVFLRKVLAAVRASHPAFREPVQTILELNNLLMPSVGITEGTSTTAAGSELDATVGLHPGEKKSLIVRVTDATGEPLPRYRVKLSVGDAARYAAGAPAAADARHGRTGAATATELYGTTNDHGIVNVTFTAPALPTGTTRVTDRLEVSYQPDFDTDASFDPPEPGDDRETTLRKLYLHELRWAGKTWEDAGKNWGAIVRAPAVTFEVTPP